LPLCQMLSVLLIPIVFLRERKRQLVINAQYNIRALRPPGSRIPIVPLQWPKWTAERWIGFLR
jgi:hypothetical protein